MSDLYRRIEDWTEDELVNELPSEENDDFEFKSSRTSDDGLKSKLSVAASAFWNSGGGIFIAGVDNSGKVDGGIPKSVGRQSRRDWTDKILAQVEPAGPYTICIIPPQNSTSLIRPDHVVLVVSFGESHVAPHMAQDRKYYIRAGAHSGAASHFLVEAIRARRGLQKPQIHSLLRIHEKRGDMVQLVVTTLSTSSALDVTIFIESELPDPLKQWFEGRLPMKVPVINQELPFKVDISPFIGGSAMFLECCRPLQLKIVYVDMLGHEYTENQMLDCKYSLGPLGQIDEPVEKIAKELKKISSQLQQLYFETTKQQR